MSLADKVGKRVVEIKSGKVDRLQRAGVVILQATVDSCSEPGSPTYHSRPGEPPLRQSGELVAGFRVEVSGDSLTMKNTAHHAKYLENGTSRMAPRDLLAGVEETRDEVRKILFNS